MLSQKAKYALRAMLMLAACRDAEEPTRLADIAVQERIPQKFLETILVELRNAGLVESRRGRSGGYRLRGSAAEISFGDVIRAIDGPLAPIRCASRHRFTPCLDCRDVPSCSIRWAMLRARDALSDALDKCTLEDALSRPIADDPPPSEAA